MPELVDSHGRIIDYIRLSLTDRCNFRCVYCMPPEGEKRIPHDEILSYEELLRLSRILASMGVSRYKITGGEPLCRKDAVEFIRDLKNLPGVKQVTLTTNGVLLGPSVERLAAIGLDGLNVSLDTLSQGHYGAITRSKSPLAEVLPVMAKARALGILVKINVVPLRGYNEDDLPELAAFALKHGYHIRFIELMPVGLGAEHEGVPQDEVRAMIENSFGALSPLDRVIGNGPAEHFSVDGHKGSVGFISALSKKFCRQCNRIRLTSSGYLKSCLHHNIGIELKGLLRSGASDKDIEEAVMSAVRKKPLAHDLSRSRGEKGKAAFLMNSVGG
ncbi:MAG: GTP 3',8-cyclase MoaA [Desulfovibrio sp.]|jgi:cyclic pyranopterin phosphate synthase|nr:GTP 3',8-cyclase MoaA [Desulfovibrio sp.]